MRAAATSLSTKHLQSQASMVLFPAEEKQICPNSSCSGKSLALSLGSDGAGVWHPDAP